MGYARLRGCMPVDRGEAVRMRAWHNSRLSSRRLPVQGCAYPRQARGRRGCLCAAAASRGVLEGEMGARDPQAA